MKCLFVKRRGGSLQNVTSPLEVKKHLENPLTLVTIFLVSQLEHDPFREYSGFSTTTPIPPSTSGLTVPPTNLYDYSRDIGLVTGYGNLGIVKLRSQPTHWKSSTEVVSSVQCTTRPSFLTFLYHVHLCETFVAF